MIGALFTVARAFAGRVFSRGGTDVLGQILHRDTAQTIAEAAVEQEEIKAGRDVAVEQVKASKQSWKDEFALFLISWPYIILFAIGTWGAMGTLWHRDFDLALQRFDLTIQHLSSFPEWYTWGIFVPVILSCFGIRALNGRVKRNANVD